MQMRDYLVLGLKLLGVYFVVYGLAGLFPAIAYVISMVAASVNQAGDAVPRNYVITPHVFAVLPPLIHVAGGVILVRYTDYCLKLIGSGANA